MSLGYVLEILLYYWEKMGRTDKLESQMVHFINVVDNVKIKDLGFNVAPFTWCNGRDGEARV